MEFIAIHGSYLVQIKSQTYQVKVNASTVDPVLYNLKPGVAVFSVNSLRSDSTTSHHHVVSSHRSSSNHHDQGSTDHSKTQIIMIKAVLIIASSSNHHDQGST